MNAAAKNPREIFLAAVKLVPDEWDAYLGEACGSDAELRRRVKGLLQAHAEVGSFLEPSVSGLSVTTAGLSPITERPGTMIGPYKLLQQIGEGGMGVVYMAEQETPVRRRVALKIIKPGMDSAQVISRFEAERQALAMMDHQNIARVLDAGATESGRPYFVMELVHGIPITKYCDDNHLTPRQRLELFVPVCQAVQHAHQKGIIHRDIKPSNVLVCLYDGKPVPKIIDFGVAKATEQRLTERTLFTQFGTIVGTFEYMAPEQAEVSQLGVDTRSDIYSLGVLLYELLTGTTPLERQRLRDAGYAEVLRLIREEEPPRPSTRLSTSGAALGGISAQRGTEPAKLAKLVRGELDWIVMKALEKDRTRRYDTATGLAQDVQHYLADEPVLACPPSAGYRLRKVVRKHKKALVTAGTIAALLMLGTGVSAWLAVRATNAEGEKARALNAALVSSKLADDEKQAAQDEAKKAKAARDEARASEYVANANLIEAAWAEKNLGLVTELLEKQRPKVGEQDLRGFEWRLRDRLCNPQVRTLTLDYSLEVPRNSNLVRVAFSADGTRFAAFGAPKIGQLDAFKVWNLANGAEIAKFEGTESTGFTLQISLSRDGKRAAVYSLANPGKGRLRILDVDRQKVICNVDGVMVASAISPDGQRVAGSASLFGKSEPGKGWGGISSDHPIFVRDLATDKEMAIEKMPGSVSALAFSPDGKRLAIVSRKIATAQEKLDGTKYVVRILDSATGKTQHEITWTAAAAKDSIAKLGMSPAPETVSFAFSPDSQRLAVVYPSSKDMKLTGHVRIWDVETGKELLAFPVLPAWRYCLAFNPTGDRLAVWPADKASAGQVFESKTGQLVQSYLGHSDAVEGVAFSPDGAQLYSASVTGTIKVWDARIDIQEDSPIQRKSEGVMSRDGSRQIVNLGTKISVRDAAGKEIYLFSQPKLFSGPPIISYDGKHVVTVQTTGFLQAWIADTGKVLLEQQQWTPPKQGVKESGPNPREQTQASFSRNGQLLALVIPKFGVKVFALPAFRPVFAREGEMISAKISPDGRTVVTFQKRGNADDWELDLCLWDVTTEKQLSTITAVDTAQRQRGIKLSLNLRRLQCEYSSDGTRLAVIKRISSQEADRIVLDTFTGAELTTVRIQYPSEKAFVGIVWSPDSKRIAMAVSSSTRGKDEAAVWESDTGKQLFRVKGHLGSTLAGLAFSPDAKRLAAAWQLSPTQEGEVKLCDTATGAELLNLKASSPFGAPLSVYSSRNQLTFSPDGNKLSGHREAKGKAGGDDLFQYFSDVVWDATPRIEAK